MKIAVVYNELAGRHKAANIAEVISGILARKGIEHDLFGNRSSFSFNAHTHVFVIGGDGTLNHLVNHVNGEMPPIAIFKGGTGNDLATHLYGDAGIEETIRIALNASPRPVDAGLCNGRYFINMFGLGFDGEVLRRMETIRWIGSFLGYYTAILRTIFFYREPKLEVSVNGQIQGIDNFLLLMASNAPTTGGGFRVSPKARIDDGMLDLITIDSLPLWKRLRYLPTIRKGEHLGLPFVHHRSMNSLRVTSDHTLRAQLDGELITGHTFEISILPGKFRFLY